MPGFVRKITAAAVAASLMAVPTGVIAAAPGAPGAAPAAATAAPANPWLALSAMTSTSSTAATAAAAQGEEGIGFPPIAPLIVIVGTIILGIWIITRDGDDDEDGFDFPISP